jgi:hypothetical protein
MEQLTRQVAAYLTARNRQKKAQLQKSAKAA